MITIDKSMKSMREYSLNFSKATNDIVPKNFKKSKKS